MNNLKKKAIVLMATASMAATSLVGCGSFKNSDVVATVGDSEITAGVANFYARYQQANIEAIYGTMLGDNMWSQEVSEGTTYEENMKESIMDSLQQLYILQDHMEEYNISLTAEEEQKIEEAASKFDEANSSKAKNVVSGDKEVVKEVLTLLTVQNKMSDAITVDVDTEVSDEEAAQKSMQYVRFPFSTTDEEGNTSDMTDDEKAALKETAAIFLDGAKTAEDFEAYTKEKGYEAQKATFDAESTSPAAELIVAADALEVGAFTEVIETDTALYVAKLTSLLDREATDAEKESIVNTRKNDKFQEVFDSWKDAIEVKVNEKVWGKITFEDTGVTMKAKPEENDNSEE